MDNKNVTSVARIERMIAKLKKDNPLIDDWEKYEVSFEFVCASLFPKIWDNVQATMKDNYTQGYIQGLKDGENPEIKGNIRDEANLNQLLVLANMESYNSILIEQGKLMSERLVLLRNLAVKQMSTLSSACLEDIKRLPGGDKID